MSRLVKFITQINFDQQSNYILKISYEALRIYLCLEKNELVLVLFSKASITPNESFSETYIYWLMTHKIK